MSSRGIFVKDNKIPCHLESNSWISSFRRAIVKRSAFFRQNLRYQWPGIVRRSSRQSVYLEGNDPLSGPFVPPDWFSFWNGNYGWSCSGLKQSLASSTSKFCIEIPRVDDEDLKSSTDSTNSTSLIHCIASVGNCEHVQTSVLNLIFQQAKVAGVRELVKMKIRNLQSLLVCSIILWRVSSTEDDWIFGWRSALASQILISFWSITLLRWRHVKRFLNSFLPTRVQFLRIRSWRGSLWICRNVSWYTVCIPKYLAAHLCVAAIRMKASIILLKEDV